MRRFRRGSVLLAAVSTDVEQCGVVLLGVPMAPIRHAGGSRWADRPVARVGE